MIITFSMLFSLTRSGSSTCSLRIYRHIYSERHNISGLPRSAPCTDERILQYPLLPSDVYNSYLKTELQGLFESRLLLMAFPNASIPTTAMTSVHSGIMTGSFSIGTLQGRCFAPSASISTTSASCRTSCKMNHLAYASFSTDFLFPSDLLLPDLLLQDSYYLHNLYR